MRLRTKNEEYDEVCDIDDGIIFPKELFEFTKKLNLKILKYVFPKIMTPT